ncbi:MAG: toll/interleukin-1 receptor domain-containing protein [Firmicutes bacterium]|nr:toll/interleukin-1 receptor domain-containing protein [Bacillota bacterium]
MSGLYDIFLSYHRVDLPAVKIIAKLLIKRKLKPFLDKWNLTPGQPWLTEIEEALHSSRAFGVFIGPKGIGPVQVAEMRAALHRKFQHKGYPVIPILLPGSNPSSHQRLPTFLVQQTWIDLRSNLRDQTELQRLIGLLRHYPADEKNEHLSIHKTSATPVDKKKLLRALVLLEIEDLIYLGEITGIRRAEISSDGIKTLAVSLVNRAEILGKLEELQANLVTEYAAIALKVGIG